MSGAKRRAEREERAARRDAAIGAIRILLTRPAVLDLGASGWVPSTTSLDASHWRSWGAA